MKKEICLVCNTKIKNLNDALYVHEKNKFHHKSCFYDLKGNAMEMNKIIQKLKHLKIISDDIIEEYQENNDITIIETKLKSIFSLSSEIEQLTYEENDDE